MGDKCRAAPLPASCVLSLVLAVVLVPTPARGQAGAAGSTTSSTKKTPAVRPWAPSLTADGQPDLQGVWLISTATPLERPKALEGRQSLTNEEVADALGISVSTAKNYWTFARTWLLHEIEGKQP